MPYIKQEDREKFKFDIDFSCGVLEIEDFIKEDCETSGELNYLITAMLKAYAEKHGKCYSTYNSIIGVLECAKQEFYRRQISPYEDEKIIENGDVF